MKKILLIFTINTIMASCAITKQDKIESTVVSWGGCCKYEVNTDDTITYYDYTVQRYQEDGYHTTYWFDSLHTAKRTVDNIENNCRDNHNK